MARYVIKRTAPIEALSFDEFVEYGKNQSGVNINDGMPWSFDYKGFSVTHENDEKYIINRIINFNKDQIIILDEGGQISIMDSIDFENSYSKLLD